ncbi:MAG: hypothetical protein ACREOO_26580 [bacterium]
MYKNVHIDPAGDDQDSGLAEFESRAAPYVNLLYRTALILTGSPRSAKSLLSDTYVKAQRGHGGFLNNDELGMWMFRMLFGAFGSSHHGVDLRLDDSVNMNQTIEFSSEALLARVQKNTSLQYPLREMTSSPGCAYPGM